MIPVYKKNPLYSLKIPELSGGVNFRDGASLIGDSQLTDCKNMWYKDGALKTRPAITENIIQKNMSMQDEILVFETKVFENIKTTINGALYVLCVITGLYREQIQSEELAFIRFYFISTANLPLSSKKYIDLGSLSIDSLATTDTTFLPIEHRGNIYVYTREVSIAYPDGENRIYIIKKISEGGYDEPITISEDIYAPLVLTNCWPSFGESGTADQLIIRGATQVEGFNLLGNLYRMEFSTYDASEDGYIVQVDANDRNSKYSFLEFSLPYTKEGKGLTGQIEAKYTDIEGLEHIHTVSVPQGFATVEKAVGDDGLYMHAFFKAGVCHITLNSNAEADKHDPGTIYYSNYIHNNMTVTAPCENSVENWEKVTQMTKAEWYGNTSLGLNGGNRVFLGGNEKETEKSLIIWSDFDNPLYFSENNYAYIGDKNQKITAFGKQGSSLIIFKEQEIYAMQYSQGNVTAEQLANQTVIDVTAQLAYFPVIQIHSSIGCNCPDTVQLCRNRLVWADTTGKVYTLTSQNQNSERNVFEVSEMIEKKLVAEDKNALAKATSADYDGKYFLAVRENIYVMDYNSYGYVNIASYNKQEDANILLPWFIWEVPTGIDGFTHLFFSGEHLTTITIKQPNDQSMRVAVVGVFDKKNADSLIIEGLRQTIPVKSMIQTKFYDFGQPSRLKNVPSIDISLGNNGGNPINLSILTNNMAEDRFTLTVQESNTSEDSITYVVNRHIVPYSKLFTRIGIRLECDGFLSLDGISLNYKIAGGSK